MTKDFGNALKTLSAVIEIKDPYTYNHQLRVSKLAVILANEIGLEQDRVKAVERAAILHDLGKLKVPTELLIKPTKLDQEEFELIKKHPITSYNMLSNIEFDQPITDMILQHHEKLDGSGYPYGLEEDEILLESKILAIADIVEAVSSHRPYRPALGMDKAYEILEDEKGIKLDYEISNLCQNLLKNNRNVINLLQSNSLEKTKIFA